jgi:hypothetical protein
MTAWRKSLQFMTAIVPKISCISSRDRLAES